MSPRRRKKNRAKKLLGWKQRRALRDSVVTALSPKVRTTHTWTFLGKSWEMSFVD